MKGYQLSLLLAMFVFTIGVLGCGLADVPGQTDEQAESGTKPKKEKVKYTGVRETQYDNGDIKSRVNYVDGRMQGKAYNYYKGGQIHSEFNYVDGRQEGITKWFFEDGTLFQEIPYKDGQFHGTWKQYHENGELQAEMPYFESYEGVGLKEYSSAGKLKTKYPKLMVKEKDETVFNNTFTLTLSLSEKPNWVEYYYGELTEGKYLGLYMTKLPVKNMQGTFELEIPKGQFVMKKLDLVARIKTANGLYYLIHKPYNLSVGNR